MSTTHPSNRLVRAEFTSRPIMSLALCALGVAAIVASAKAQIPFWPVPLTLQTLVIAVLAMAYGSRLGGVTLAAYLALGAAGLPVFAGTPEKGIGLAYMAGPTGGYLVGFLLGGALMGWLADRGWGRYLPRAVAAVTAGHLVILALGTLWLSLLIGWPKAVAAGLVPFLWPSVVKTLLAAFLVVGASRLVQRLRG